MNTPVSDLLRAKRHVVFASPEATTAEAIKLMNDNNTGSILILDEDRSLRGIFTERDVLRRVIGPGLDPNSTAVGTVMTAEVVVVDRKAGRLEVRTIMEKQHIRHVPVLDGNNVVGVVSLRDILRSENAEKDFEIDQLKSYVTARPYPVYPR
jgi:CBS domain-containing protein